MTTPRLVFAGTPEFARASLEALLEAGFPPVAVLTQPDRPAGRGRRLTASPVKSAAGTAGIPVLQPVTLRDPGAVRDIAACRADLMIVVAYGLMLPQAVLELPRLGCLNVHASLVITSYSIHYTKLYDTDMYGRTLKATIIAAADQLAAIIDRQRDMGALKGASLVITSYSIHYTKLYDSSQERLLLMVVASNRQ